MRIFLKNIGIYFVLLFISFAALSILFDNKKKNFNSAFVDKLEILRSYKDTRKIILLGGSGTGFSLSAEQVERETGIKTINLGHHWGFGLLDYLPFMMRNLTKDDVIVFSPEWNFFSDPHDYDKATLNNLIKKNYRYSELMANNRYKLMFFLDKIDYWPNSSDTNSPYRYDCINANGDIISHCDIKGSGASYYEISKNEIKVSEFENVFPFLRSHRTVILFPPTQNKVYADHSDYLRVIEREILIKNFELIDQVEDNLYPDSAFFDAQYHLTCDFRKKRTEKLIHYLRSSF